MSRVINVQDLKKSFEAENVETPENVLKKVESESQMASKSKMQGPGQIAAQEESESVATPTPVYKKPYSMIRVGFLLICVIILQAFMNSKYSKAFLAKFISNPTIAMLTTSITFLIIVAGLFFLLIKI